MTLKNGVCSVNFDRQQHGDGLDRLRDTAERKRSGRRHLRAGTHGFAVNKKAERMAKVVYEAPHFNARETGVRRGAGRDFAT